MIKSRFVSHSGAELELSQLGLGTAPLGNMFAAQTEESAILAVRGAIDKGINFFDTAPLYGYGLSERRLGIAIRDTCRDSLKISTKVGRLLEVVPHNELPPQNQWIDVPKRKVIYDYTYDGVMRSYEFSLERLGVDRIDILWCHDIDVSTHGSVENRDKCASIFLSKHGGYRAMEELRRSGEVDAIGLGVNEWEICDRFVQETDLDLYLLAGRFTLLEQEAAKSFLPRCLENSVGVIIGGPFNSGILATGPVDGAYFNYAVAPKQILERTHKIQAICSLFDVSLISAALQFPFLHPAVLSVIPGGVSQTQISNNIEAFEKNIPKELWLALQSANLIDEAVSL